MNLLNIQQSRKKSIFSERLLTLIFKTTYIRRAFGAVAQMGERLNGIQEVVGSSPISSTNKPSEGAYCIIAGLLSTLYKPR